MTLPSSFDAVCSMSESPLAQVLDVPRRLQRQACIKGIIISAVFSAAVSQNCHRMSMPMIVM